MNLSSFGKKGFSWKEWNYTNYVNEMKPQQK